MNISTLLQIDLVAVDISGDLLVLEVGVGDLLVGILGLEGIHTPGDLEVEVFGPDIGDYARYDSCDKEGSRIASKLFIGSAGCGHIEDALYRDISVEIKVC